MAAQVVQTVSTVSVVWWISHVSASMDLQGVTVNWVCKKALSSFVVT